MARSALARWWLLFSVGLLAVVTGGVGRALAEVPKASRLVQSDAVIYLEATRPSDLVDQVAGGSFQKLLSTIPQYSRYIKSEDYSRGREILDFVLSKLDTTWDKGLRNLAGGGAVLAVEVPQGGLPSIYLLIVPRDASFLTQANTALLELARKDAADKGKPDPVKSAEYRGIRGWATGEKGAYAIVNDVLVVGDRGDTVKRLIDRTLDGVKAGQSIVDDAAWKTRQAETRPDALAWGFARLDRLRQIDAKKFEVPEKTPLPLTFFFGSWIEALRKGSWIAASLGWSGEKLAAGITLPKPEGGYAALYKGFIPPEGSAAAPLLSPPGTIASLSLWRDLAAVWEAKADLFQPQEAQDLSKLDTPAGQFFGGSDFAAVAGSINNNWRLVIARQDYSKMKPVPDLKYPAFALVLDLKPDDEDFPLRLKMAFQSFVGLANLGSAQNKAPPLELGSETFEEVTIATTRFMLPKSGTDPQEPVHYRHNFSPSVAHVGNHFIISSSVGLTRDLIKALKSPAKSGDTTLTIEADGSELAKLLEINRSRMVMQNMLEKGQDKAQAEEGVDTLLSVLRYLGHGRLTARDGADTFRLSLDFALGRSKGDRP